MTQVAKSFRFRVATAGATTVTGNVDWTETVRIADMGEIGGQNVSPIGGGTSARPWTIPIIDADEVITARIADSGGRAQLLRRLADFSISTDGGSTWTVKATARIDDIHISGSSLKRVEFTMQDERLIERTTTIFKAGNTTRLSPPGLQSAWLDYQPAPLMAWQVNSSDGGASTTAYVIQGVQDARGGEEELNGFRPSSDFIRLLEEDIIDDPAADQGNFTNLRFSVNGTDREVIKFGSSPVTDPLKELRERGSVTFVSVAGLADTVGFTRLCYFHMQDADPSPDTPLHLGGQDGIDPFTLVKNIYDGSYQDATNPSLVRYDSTAFSAYDESTNPDGLIDNPRYPKMHFRIDGPAEMAQWLEDNIYGPLGVVPFINADGEVSPRIVTQPATDQLPDPDNLFQFTAANLKDPHPDWSNVGRELLTVVEYTFEYAIAPSYTVWPHRNPNSPGGGLFGSLFGIINDITPTAGGQDVGFDLLQRKTQLIAREGDRVDDYRVTRSITVRGIHRLAERKAFAAKFGQDLLDRFQDGPVYVDGAHGTAATESVVEGEWCTIDLDTLPSLQNQSRSGSRVVQVMTRVDSLRGPSFQLLEAGPHLQPLSDPAVTLSANSNDPENAIDVQVSTLGTGEGYEVHLAVNATEPAEKSPLWQYRALRGTQNETVTVRRLPAGETIWARPRATKSDRISSDWGTADSQATTGYTAPSSLADSGVAGDEATVTWTNGESDRDVMVDLIVTSGGAQEQGPVRLPAGTASYTFTGLDLSTGYTARAWHVDDYGGESTKGTDTLTTTGTATTLEDPYLLVLLVGDPA